MDLGNKPTKKTITTKGIPPRDSTTPNGQHNTKKRADGELVGLNFKADKEFIKSWKIHCVTNDISQIDQFKAMFELWKKHHGG